MTTYQTRLLPFFGVLLLLNACATGRPVVESPVVQLIGVELLDISLRQQTFRLHFDVSNPNPFPAAGKERAVQSFLEDRQFASGESGGRFTVPASGDSKFDISVELDLMSSAASLATLLRSGTSRPIPYAVSGSLAVAIPFTRPLKFARDGTIVVR